MVEIHSDDSLCALLVGSFEQDRLLVRETFRRSGWRLLEAADRRRSMQLLEQINVQVVIAESDLPHWNWKQVLRDLRKMDQPPALVVTSRTADDSLWAEVLNIGGYDVLAQPLASNELERVVASAGRNFWRRPVQSAAGNVAPLYRTAR